MEKLQNAIIQKKLLEKNTNILSFIKKIILNIKIHIIIRKLCKEQANKIYKDTYNLYNDILKKVFEKNN